MMAKRWLVAAVLLVTLSGCGDDADAEPATVPLPATSSDAPAASTPAVAASRTTAGHAAARTTKLQAVQEKVRTGTDGFVEVVQTTMPEVAVDHRDEEIVAMAQQACVSLAADEDADVIVAETRALGTDRATARRLIRLAIDTVCPDEDRRTTEF